MGSSTTSESIRLTSRSYPWKVLPCCCSSASISSIICSAESAPKRVPLMVLLILATSISYTPSPTGPLSEARRLTCLLPSSYPYYYQSCHVTRGGLVFDSISNRFERRNRPPVKERSLRVTSCPQSAVSSNFTLPCTLQKQDTGVLAGREGEGEGVAAGRKVRDILLTLRSVLFRIIIIIIIMSADRNDSLGLSIDRWRLGQIKGTFGDQRNGFFQAL